MYTMQKSQTTDAKNMVAAAKSAQAAIQTKLDESTATIKKDEATLASAYIFPDETKMSPQCSPSDNSKTYLAPVTKSPIEGYNVYFVNCLTDLIAGKTTTGKVIAFKVGSDGTQEFAFGAGSGEPYCISGKLTNPTAAAAISKATSLPVCKTF